MRFSVLRLGVVAFLMLAGPVLVSRALADNFEACAKAGGDEAIAACTRAISSGRFHCHNLAVVYYNRGVEYQNEGDLDRAIVDYTEAIRLDPNYVFAYSNRRWARALAGRDLAQALDDCNEALRLRPGDGDTLNSRGLVQLKLEAFDLSVADYSAAIAQNPKDASSLYGRGIAKLKSGDSTGGDADIAAAKAIKPDIADVYAGYGVR